jgi:hypothetical protein
VRNLNVAELSGTEFLTSSEAPSHFLPDSRRGWEPLRTWEAPEPPALRFVVADLLPEGYPTSLYGDGATGKSYLALMLGMHVVLGLPFLGRDVVRGRVLFADAELDEDEFLRRAYRVARGLGLSAPPEGLFYQRLPESLAKRETVAECADMISGIAPILTILDSFNAAAFGADTNASSDVTALMRGIGSWGTTLIIDHIPKTPTGTNLSTVRAHGSAFKFNLSRSAISAVRTDGGAITLRQTKSNFGPRVSPIYAALAFEPQTVRMELVGLDDSRLAGAEQHLTAEEKVLFALRDFGDRGATVAEIAAMFETVPKTVQDYFSNAHKAGRVERLGGGRWRAPTPDAYGDGNGKESAE